MNEAKHIVYSITINIIVEIFIMQILFIPHGNIQYSQLHPERREWVIRNSYEKLFDLLIQNPAYKIGFEASGETIKAIAELCPDVLEKLNSLLKQGKVEAIGSPHTHIMLSNIDPEIGLESLKHGIQTWEKYTGHKPKVGWNPECSWADFIPDIFKEAGFEALVMDGDSFMLSFKEVREATKLHFDVRGHSNKNKLFLIEDYIKDKPDLLKYFTNPSKAPNGLQLLFRSDCMANPMLWYLMGATEGHRESLVKISEISQSLSRWKERIENTGSFILPYAEDAEYIGTSAYFYVKQFGQARFFEEEAASIQRFEELLQTAVQGGYTLSTPSEIIGNAKEILPNEHISKVENGIAWHGGTAKAWANTVYARIMDPVCYSIFKGIKSIAETQNLTIPTLEGTLREALRKVTSAYVSDSRWPPAPTSPGRFNVEESLRDLDEANALMRKAMEELGLSDQKMLYSPGLMQSQINSIRDELMGLEYFGEKKE